MPFKKTKFKDSICFAMLKPNGDNRIDKKSSHKHRTMNSILCELSQKVKLSPALLKLLSQEDLDHIIDFLLDDEDLLIAFLKKLEKKAFSLRYKKFLLHKFLDSH